MPTIDDLTLVVDTMLAGAGSLKTEVEEMLRQKGDDDPVIQTVIGRLATHQHEMEQLAQQVHDANTPPPPGPLP